MSRLKRSWSKPEVVVDKKGYVMINPVRRPSSPASTPSSPSTLPKPVAVSSMLYENVIPLKTRNFEVRRVPHGTPNEEPKNASGSSPPKAFELKPEKPSRHCYENLDVGGQQTKEGELVGFTFLKQNNEVDKLALTLLALCHPLVC